MARWEMVRREGPGGRSSPSATGSARPRFAVARKLTVILHRMWIDGTEFNWSKKEIVA
jgi:transposase